jgi:transcriptional regulator with XRE-family HTH domain
MKEQILNAFKEERKAQGLTYNELAKRAGMDEQSLCAIIQGKRDNPSLSTLMRICKGLGINPNVTFSRNNDAINQ